MGKTVKAWAIVDKKTGEVDELCLKKPFLDGLDRQIWAVVSVEIRELPRPTETRKAGRLPSKRKKGATK